MALTFAPTALTIIGGVLTITALFFIALGDFWKNIVVEDLWTDWPVRWISPQPSSPNKSVNFAFVVHEKSRCRVAVSPKSGDFKLALGEIPTISVGAGSQWQLYSRFEVPVDPSKGEQIFEHDLPPGPHVVQFVPTGLALDATLSLKLTHAQRRLESLVDPGFALLTMSIPILITGIVTLLFGA
jgi:hypothetical protein